MPWLIREVTMFTLRRLMRRAVESLRPARRRSRMPHWTLRKDRYSHYQRCRECNLENGFHLLPPYIRQILVAPAVC
jgi:hypothetical protein